MEGVLFVFMKGICQTEGVRTSPSLLLHLLLGQIVAWAGQRLEVKEYSAVKKYLPS